MGSTQIVVITGVGKRARNRHGPISVFVLEYKKWKEEHSLNATQVSFQHANNNSEEQKYLASALDKLSLADFSDTYVIA